MVKTVELKRDGIGRLVDCKPFLLPDVLEIQLKTVGYDMSDVFVSMQNGTIRAHKKVENNTFEVDKELLFAGFLNMRVHMYHDGKEAKIWDVYPIKLVETNFGIEAFEYLRVIEEKVDKVQEEVNELKKQHEIIM